ncbi:facilitated trehalose transporter Tret1-like [Macrosteles quadrilineatus]|uniref:facilitated trehalose transporter Tret1-like n=1 Tax=Macrosteles quadrilineatus TaxID=74068 RepID=UPI0023E1AA9A|nr:facilitated trehalose transporter Tret1-like [Macrosteles quadrilineatus]
MEGQNNPGLCRQLIAGSAASLGVLACAAVWAWLTPTLPHLLGPDSEIPMTSEEASWMVSMPELGNFISPLPASYIADHFGRKIVILTSAPLFFLGWVVIIYCKTILALNVGRIIQGLAIGVVYTIVPVYLGEIASPAHRGAVTSAFYLLWWFGFLLEYIFGPALSLMNFTYLSASSSVIFFLAFIWQPESPYYYLMRNDLESAKKSLTWLLNSTEKKTDEELETMRKCIEEDKKVKVKWNELVANPTDRKAMIIMFLIGYIRQCCGVIPLSVYSTQTLEATNNNFFISSDNVTIIMGAMMLISCVFSLFTLDKFGRKPMLFISCTISGVLVLCTTIYYFCQFVLLVNVDNLNWIPPVAMIVLSGVSVIGIFPVNTAYSSELFTSNMRSTASGIFNIYTTFVGIIVLKFYLTVFDNLGVYVNFLFFTFTCFLGSFLSCFIMPETKGKTFEQIRRDL